MSGDSAAVDPVPVAAEKDWDRAEQDLDQDPDLCASCDLSSQRYLIILIPMRRLTDTLGQHR